MNFSCLIFISTCKYIIFACFYTIFFAHTDENDHLYSTRHDKGTKIMSISNKNHNSKFNILTT